MFRKTWLLALGFLLLGGIVYAGNLNTSGKCPWGAACVLGHANSTSLTLTTDGGDVVMDGSVTSALGMTATTGDITATTGDITATAGDITATAGHIQGDIPRITLSSGTLTLNTLNIAMATADYNLPACTTPKIGQWVTVLVRDANETVSLVPDAGEIINYSGITPVADDELDSPTAGATTAGSSITLLCAADNTWQSIGTVGLWVDGGAS